MRKIEQDMLAATAAPAPLDWKQGNTRVYKFGGVTEVYLHGNKIAHRGSTGVWEFTLAGWNTPTTRSRLNALGAKVWTQRGQAHYNACHADGTLARFVAIGDSEWFSADPVPSEPFGWVTAAQVVAA